jgi:hypothetical protein
MKSPDDPAATAGDAPPSAQQIPGKTIDAEVKQDVHKT